MGGMPERAGKLTHFTRLAFSSFITSSATSFHIPILLAEFAFCVALKGSRNAVKTAREKIVKSFLIMSMARKKKKGSSYLRRGLYTSWSREG